MEPITYCNALLADPGISRVQFPNTQQRIEVTRLYVPLRVAEGRRRVYDAPVGDEESTANPAAYDPIARIEEERQGHERSPEALYDPEKAIHTFQRCVFTGDAGAGKTTLLRHLAITVARRSITGLPSSLPVYVELQSFVRSGQRDLLYFISAAWQDAYAFPAQQALLLLEKALDEGKALLLLDALDEATVAETSEEAERSYDAVSQAILALATRHPKASIVVTSRSATYQQRRPLVGFTTLEVIGFRLEEARKCVQNWYDVLSEWVTEANDQAAPHKSADFIEHLNTNPRLQALAANPLLLTLLVLAWADRGDLPENRAALYRIYIEKGLTDSDSQPDTRRPGEFEPAQQYRLLKAIAWHFHRKGQRYFAEHDLLQVVAEWLPATGLPTERSKDTLQVIEGEQGVLKRQAAGWHGFLHPGLQEYLAAAYANDHQEYAELYRHRADAWWQEVLLLYMEMTPDAGPFLQSLCSPHNTSTIREDIFYTNALLAGRCLAARPALKETDLRARVIERLFELLMSTRYSSLRQAAIAVLCGIRDADTNRKLVALLSNERLDVGLRWNIAEVLATSGERSIARDMAHLLADERMDAFVRWNIAGALGALGERSIARELVPLLSDERLNAELRRGIADALGTLGERSVAGDLLGLLPDERLHIDLRRGIVGTLGTLGERSVASELVGLLADERLDVGLRRTIADTLGTLGERSVVEDLVRLLADDLLDVDLRRSIADALAALGEWSVVADAMVELLADEQQDVFVRRRITGALGTLAEVSGSLGEDSERPVAKDLVQLLADDLLDADLRWSIAEVLGMLGDRSVAGNLLRLLYDDLLDVNVRRAIAIALGRLGERSTAARAMMQLLADEQQDVLARRSIVDALGRLGERSVAGELVQLLADERLDADLRWSIVDALGRLGEHSVTGDLARLLADEQQDAFVRRSIAGALGALGERLVAARAMVQMLSDDRFGVFARRGIADALSRLDERSVARDLARLLSDDRLHPFIRQSIADALGRLAEPSVASHLVQLLSNERLGADLRRSIADALAAYGADVSIVEGMIGSLQDSKIAGSVYNALWIISRRAGVWIFPASVIDHAGNAESSQVRYEIVPWQ